MNERPPPSVMDLVALAFGALAALALLAFPFTVAPSFAAMYDDFGGTLPFFTRLALTPWGAPLLGLVVLALAGLGVSRADLVRRRLLLAGAGLAGVAAIAALWWALYLPLFELTGAIAE